MFLIISEELHKTLLIYISEELCKNRLKPHYNISEEWLNFTNLY